MKRDFGTWLLGLLALVLVAGCGGSDIASVEGTVKLDDKPLPNASVEFVPSAGGRPASALTDSSGKYVLNFSGSREGAIPGPNLVRISTAMGTSSDEQGNNIPGKPETIAAEYNVKSTLEFNVEVGKKNIADFDLKSGGKVVKSGGY